MNKQVLALIGPSGSGKSSVGRALAQKLNWRFLDCDREIERRCQKTVSEIFQTLGESEFRAFETTLLEELAGADTGELVMATGGGLPAFGANLELLSSFAATIYLTARLEVLVTRLTTGGEPRPLLEFGDTQPGDSRVEKIALRLGKLIAERESFYNRARYKIDTTARNIEQLVDEIIILTGLVLLPDLQGKDLTRGIRGTED